ncbi:MAG: hypothetical protein KatS3mg102_0181 [Planctomycetota bacterium]|nr:MAG: hypothetical protein KatS3mg102_0181 [Planctomycetota bacterium]
MAYLFVLNGSARCRAFLLDGVQALTIGSAPDADVVLDDPWISAHHARLVREERGGWRIEDLDSTNGTWVNCKRVQAAALADEDVLFFGRTHALIVTSNRPPSAPLPDRRPARVREVAPPSADELEWAPAVEPAAGGPAPGGAAGEQAARRTLPSVTPWLDEAAIAEVEAEDEAAIERDAFEAPPLEEEEETCTFAAFGSELEGLGELSTDSLYAEPAVHLSAPPSPAEVVIDVGDLLDSDGTLPAAAPGPEPGPAAAPAPAAVPSPLAATPPAGPAPRSHVEAAGAGAAERELARLRLLLAEREEQIERLKQELLLLKERYLDSP